MVRWILTFLALLAVQLPPGQSLATTVGGRTASLLGVGDDGKVAIVVEGDVQEVDQLRVYQVELGAEPFVRRASHLLDATQWERVEPSPVFEAYAKLLPRGQQVKLRRGLLFTDQLQRFEPKPVDVDPVNHGSRSVAVEGAGLVVNAELVELWTTQSMRHYDAYTEPPSHGFDACLQAGKPLCSNCRASHRWVNGEKVATWECRGSSTKLPPELRGEQNITAKDRIPCQCSARAVMYQLVLKVGDRAVRGAKVLVEPYRTWQMGDGETPHLDIGLSMGTGGATLDVYRTNNGTIIAVGGAAHIPWANGTYFPVFAAVVPRRATTSRSASSD